MSTSVLKALPGILDIKRHSPSILYMSRNDSVSTGFCKPTPAYTVLVPFLLSDAWVMGDFICDNA